MRLLLLVSILSFGCGDDSTPDSEPPDVGRDGGRDGSTDAEVDIGVASDGGEDVAADAPPDAPGDAGPGVHDRCEEAVPAPLNERFLVPAISSSERSECAPEYELGNSLYYTVTVPAGQYMSLDSLAGSGLFASGCGECGEVGDSDFHNDSEEAQDFILTFTARELGESEGWPDGFPAYVTVTEMPANGQCGSAQLVVPPQTFSNLTTVGATSVSRGAPGCSPTFVSLSRLLWYAVDLPAGGTLEAVADDYVDLGRGGTPPSVYILDGCDEATWQCLDSNTFGDPASYTNDTGSSRRVIVGLSLGSSLNSNLSIRLL